MNAFQEIETNEEKQFKNSVRVARELMNDINNYFFIPKLTEHNSFNERFSISYRHYFEIEVDKHGDMFIGFSGCEVENKYTISVEKNDELSSFGYRTCSGGKRDFYPRDLNMEELRKVLPNSKIFYRNRNVYTGTSSTNVLGFSFKYEHELRIEQLKAIKTLMSLIGIKQRV